MLYPHSLQTQLILRNITYLPCHFVLLIVNLVLLTTESTLGLLVLTSGYLQIGSSISFNIPWSSIPCPLTDTACPYFSCSKVSFIAFNYSKFSAQRINIWHSHRNSVFLVLYLQLRLIAIEQIATNAYKCTTEYKCFLFKVRKEGNWHLLDVWLCAKPCTRCLRYSSQYRVFKNLPTLP